MELYNIHNFNSSSQIISALNMNPVRRLQKTWNNVPKIDRDNLKKLEDIMSPLANYKEYRDILKEIGPDVPCIPRVEVVLRDITFVEEIPDTTEKKEVNFYKMSQLSKALNTILFYWTKEYKYEEDEIVQQILHHKKIKREPDLENESKILQENKEKTRKLKTSRTIDKEDSLDTLESTIKDKKRHSQEYVQVSVEPKLTDPIKLKDKKRLDGKRKSKKKGKRDRTTKSFTKSGAKKEKEGSLSFPKVFSEMSESSDEYHSFEKFLQNSSVDIYLKFFTEVSNLETRNMEEKDVKPFCDLIMNKYLGFRGDEAKIAVTPAMLQLVEKQKNNPTKTMFKDIKIEIYDILQTQYLEFIQITNENN